VLDESINIDELRRQVDTTAEMLHVKPYPTVEAILNMNEIAAHEYGAGVENPGICTGSRNSTTKGSSTTSSRGYLCEHSGTNKSDR
jgi:hypothetical protein